MCASSVSCIRYRITTHISAMVLLIGVPLAKVVPRLSSRLSRTYRVFTNKSNARSELVLGNPAILSIFEKRHKFFAKWLSSTMSQSMPRSSKLSISSFFAVPFILSSLVVQAFFALANCLTMAFPRPALPRWRMAIVMLLISSLMYDFM